MLFDIEEDKGSAIVAYVVPDSGGTTPSIRLRSNGIDLLTLAANDRRQNLIEAGRHATGQCGFIIDETLLPGLATYADLDIIETSRNLLVYRRRPPQTIDRDVFRLETHLAPLRQLDEAFKDRFQYWYSGIDQFGLETSLQVFCLNGPSKYASGRLLFKTFEHHLSRGMKAVIVIRDPFHELAERLLLLKGIGVRADEVIGPRDAITFAPVIAALQDCDLADDAACRRFFKRSPTAVLNVLSNPLVRQLTGKTLDEMPRHSSVASALDALASFDILGLRAEPTAFRESLGDVLGLAASQVPDVEDEGNVVAFGERLRAIRPIADILDMDLEVFDLIARAFKAAAA